MAAISPSRRVSTSSKTLYIRRASFGMSLSASAAQMPSVSGRQREVRASTRRNSSGVEIGKSGLQITTGRRGMGVTGVSRSPRPSASIVPPATQYGTSEPTSAPSSSSCAREKPEPVERAQHGRRIRRAAAQPRTHGDALVQPDVHAAVEARALEKHLRRAHGHIVRPTGQIAAVGLGAADTGAVERNGHVVVQIHTLHDHAQVVKPVGARTEHVQRQVQLCPRGLSCCTGHSFFSSKSRSMSCAPSSTYGPLAPFASEYGRPEPSDTRLSYSTNGTGSAPCAPLAMYVV